MYCRPGAHAAAEQGRQLPMEVPLHPSQCHCCPDAMQLRTIADMLSGHGLHAPAEAYWNRGQAQAQLGPDHAAPSGSPSHGWQSHGSS